MPTINNATVATGTGLSTAGNGGRKLVRLNNGNQYVIARNGAVLNLYKTTDNWATQTTYSLTQVVPVIDASIATDGTRLWVIANNSNQIMRVYNISDSAPSFASYTEIEPNTQSAFGNNTITVNSAGTEIHAAWSSKNSTYSSSFNIRYAKGTIAADGSVTWSAVEQVTVGTTTTQNMQNPSILFDKNGLPTIAHELNNNGIYRIIITNKQTVDDGFSFPNPPWKSRIVFSGGSYAQSNVSAIFVPQSVNGLANGRMWVACQGKDATDSAKFNIRTAFSDDGGFTWSTPVKQTSGNLYDQMNASLTADKNGKVLLYWDGDENASGTTVTVTNEKVFNNGVWGSTTGLSGDNHYGVSTLFDRTFSLGMTRAPLIRYYASGVRFTGNYLTGASVSPASSALGNKETPSVLSYTVTPESGSTITSIVEKVNGTTVNTYSNPASLSRTFTIPLANWDALKYYNTHTISVTVTDSNGMTNTQTYTFNKALANDASLLEGAKAAKDGKDRISTKRDVLAGQVGLAAGSTFDAISAQLASGAVKKWLNGTATASANSITVTGLGFKPRIISMWSEQNGPHYRRSIDNSLTGLGAAANNIILQWNGSTASALSGYSYSITDTGFTAQVGTTATTWNWLAIE